jgi:hypothetical protein
MCGTGRPHRKLLLRQKGRILLWLALAVVNIHDGTVKNLKYFVTTEISRTTKKISILLGRTAVVVKDACLHRLKYSSKILLVYIVRPHRRCLFFYDYGIRVDDGRCQSYMKKIFTDDYVYICYTNHQKGKISGVTEMTILLMVIVLLLTRCPY